MLRSVVVTVFWLASAAVLTLEAVWYVGMLRRGANPPCYCGCGAVDAATVERHHALNRHFGLQMIVVTVLWLLAVVLVWKVAA